MFAFFALFFCLFFGSFVLFFYVLLTHPLLADHAIYLGKLLDELAGTVLLLSVEVESDVLRIVMERLLDFLSKMREICYPIQICPTILCSLK